MSLISLGWLTHSAPSPDVALDVALDVVLDVVLDVALDRALDRAPNLEF